MTKTKATELMLKHSRAIVDPALARKIAQAFGYKLSELGIVPQKVCTIGRATYSEETAELKGVSMYRVAQELVRKIFGVKIESPCMGVGSYAEHTTEMCVERLKNN